MLNKVFQSEPFVYNSNEFATFSLRGIVTQPVPTLHGPDTLYMFVETLAHGVIGAIQGELYSWDAAQGQFLAKELHDIGVFSNTSILMSRGGILYFLGLGNIDNTFLIPFSITHFTNDVPGQIPASRFAGGFSSGLVQLDEEVDVLMTANFAALNLFQLSTGKFLTTLILPDAIIAIGLQNTNCVYCLCANRMLVVVDYVQGKVLGAVKGPPSLLTGGNYNTSGSLNLFWYARYQRILIAELVPDVAGLAQTVIRGFAPNPVATRLTVPIPLKEPLTNRTIPVLTCLVDDSNFGLAGALISATASGDDGTTIMANGTYTDRQGRANIPTKCGDSPATLAIDCSATV